MTLSQVVLLRFEPFAACQVQPWEDLIEWHYTRRIEFRCYKRIHKFFIVCLGRYLLMIMIIAVVIMIDNVIDINIV